MFHCVLQHVWICTEQGKSHRKAGENDKNDKHLKMFWLLVKIVKSLLSKNILSSKGLRFALKWHRNIGRNIENDRFTLLVKCTTRANQQRLIFDVNVKKNHPSFYFPAEWYSRNLLDIESLHLKPRIFHRGCGNHADFCAMSCENGWFFFFQFYNENHHVRNRLRVTLYTNTRSRFNVRLLSYVFITLMS